jgi:hypothetical protein
LLLAAVQYFDPEDCWWPEQWVAKRVVLYLLAPGGEVVQIKCPDVRNEIVTLKVE